MTAPLGRVVATERKPNTPHEFQFWTALDSPVGIGTIVRVEGRAAGERTHSATSTAWSTEGFSYTDLQTPLHDVLGHDGDPGRARRSPPSAPRSGSTRRAVLRHVPEEPLQPVPMGAVYLATEADVAVALRMDGYLREDASTGIPIGLYRAGRHRRAPVYLDADFLLGPEAAHLNITGVSGLATKTSAVEWLLAAIFAHFPAQQGSGGRGVLQREGPRPLLPRSAGRSSTTRTARCTRRSACRAEPFDNVRYFAPYKADGVILNTLRSNEALLHNVSAADVGAARGAAVRRGAAQPGRRRRQGRRADRFHARARASTASSATRCSEQTLPGAVVRRSRGVVPRPADALEDQDASEDWRTHHVATIRKVRNRLGNISTRCARPGDRRRARRATSLRELRRTARCTWSTSPGSRRTRRIWSSRGWSPSCASTSSGATSASITSSCSSTS